MDVFLARQPIFDFKQRVKAYEILYRSGLTNEYDGLDGDKASMEVLYNTFQTFGIENLTNGKPVFINFTENLINEGLVTLFSKDFIVVEILEDVIPSDKLLEKSKYLKKQGYKIALDDFIYSPEYEGLIDIADIVKIDFQLSNKKEIINVSRNLKARGVELLAEKIESREEFEFAKKLGFTLFQGYFFSKPEIVLSKKLQPIKTSCIQLVKEVDKKELDFKKISQIISIDLAMSYNLLKLVNSAAFGFKHRIESIHHGVVALGEREMKKWVYLVIINSIGEDAPDELTRQSLIRARFLELIAQNSKYKNDSGELFLIGLFSLLDVMLKRPMEEILKGLKASDRAKDVLLNKGGDYSKLFKMVLNYEKGEWEEFIKISDKLNIDKSSVINAYMEALSWYNKLLK